MSFSVTHARIKYSGLGYASTAETRKAFLAAVPRGVAISKPAYTPTSNRQLQSNEAANGEKFFGLTMGPTMSPKDVSHIGIAIDGIATALMKQDSGGHSPSKSTLYGGRAYGVGTMLTCENGALRKIQDKDEVVVAYYLQKNGPNTALVWIVKNRKATAEHIVSEKDLDSRKRTAESDDDYGSADELPKDIPEETRELAKTLRTNTRTLVKEIDKTQPQGPQGTSGSRPDPVVATETATKDPVSETPKLKKKKRKTIRDRAANKTITESPEKSVTATAPLFEKKFD